MKKFVNVIFLLDEWETDPGKYLIDELNKVSSQWSDWVAIQKPVFFLPDLIYKFRKRFIKFLTGYYRNKSIRNNFLKITPLIPFHYVYWLKYKVIAAIDIVIMNYQIKKVLNKNYPGQKVILWIFMPKLYPVTNKLKYYKLIYHLQDNLSYDPDTGVKIDPDYDINNELIKKCDIVFSTSRTMYDLSKKYNNNTYHVPNGNDFNVLSVNLNGKTDLSEINKPIIGYLGGIRFWIDFDLIKYLLENLPDYYIVFIGPVYKNAIKDINTLKKYTNFIWIDYIEQSKLPPYLSKFSAGIIPFKINKFMDAVFPNKFYEYMSRGIPVITTALNELKEYSGLIGYSETNEQFLENCKKAVNGEFEQYKDQYISLAKNNTWKHRAIQIDGILRKELNINPIEKN